MSQSQTPSAACCNTPPIVADGYKEKGKFITVDGMKTYQTGPSSATKAILVVYDIFGFFPQTLQGADILATSDKENQYQVFMPDFFEGSPADISWYPPDNKDKEEKLGAFFGNEAAPPKTVGRIPKVVKDITSSSSGIKEWAILGYCWGGKIVNLISGPSTPFKVAAAAHPAMVDPSDAPNITIPILLLPSKDEPKDDVQKWEKGLKVKHEVEWYDEQIHGFMAARGDLKQPAVLKAYEQAYQKVLTFFHDNM